MSKTIIISPYSRGLRNGKNNPKNFPYWEAVVSELKEKNCYVIQVGGKGEKEIEGVDEFIVGLPLKKVSELIEDCDTWCSVDNFFPHLAHHQEKAGVVIFGQGDPNIFGYPENKNLLKSRTYLREKQFETWESAEYKKAAFVTADRVVNALLN